MDRENRKKTDGFAPFGTPSKPPKVVEWPWNDRGEKLDPRKYIGKCAFNIDISITGIGEEDDGLATDDEVEEEEEEKHTMEDEVTTNGQHHGSNGHFESNHRNSKNQQIPRIHFPDNGQKVKGRVTRVTRKGAWVYIGYHSMNGRERHGFLPLEQIKVTEWFIEDKMSEYERRKEEEAQLKKDWADFERAKNRQQQRLKKKRKREKQEELARKGMGNLSAAAIERKKKEKQKQKEKEKLKEQQKKKNQKVVVNQSKSGNAQSTNG